jgi:hypothetical protein
LRKWEDENGADLLTAGTSKASIFPRAMRGFAISEVDEFLDGWREDIQDIPFGARELERGIDRLEEQIGSTRTSRRPSRERSLWPRKVPRPRKRREQAGGNPAQLEARLKAEQIVSKLRRRRTGNGGDLRDPADEAGFKAEFRALSHGLPPSPRGEDIPGEEEESAR